MISFFQTQGFRFFFSNQEVKIPAHVHLIGRGGQIVIWLEPLEPALSHNLSDENLKEALRVVQDNLQMLKSKWFEWSEAV